MKFLFDQNISHRILKLLPEKFKNSTHVKSENLINFPDMEIWEYAKKNDFIIVTQDSDFNELNYLHGFPPKIIWIRTGNLRTSAILNILVDHFNEIEKFVEDRNYGCFEIIRIK
jgi:predicted nuclease of predicted toxin-antitoxin system